MRDIKFRGQCVRTGEWVYGSLLQDSGESKIAYRGESGARTFVDVAAETVGQWTGLKDATGREVFEGDVVKYDQVNLVNLLEVAYKGEEACFIGRYPCEIGDYEMLNDVDFRVVGNIHQGGVACEL